MPDRISSDLTLAAVHSAAANAGAKPSRSNGKRFSFSSAVCHSGDNPAGCWATLNDGRVTLHCHKCDFPASDQQIRGALGLPDFLSKPAAPAEPVQLATVYHHPDGQDRISYRKDCPPGTNCGRPGCPKHSWQSPGLSLTGCYPHAWGEDDGNEILIWAEGEKAARAISRAGYAALSSIGGAGLAGNADYSPYSGRRIAFHPDNDQAGRKAAYAGMKAALDGGAQAVALLPQLRGFAGADLADLPNADKIRDFLDRYLADAEWTDRPDVLAYKQERAELNHRCQDADNRPLIDKSEQGRHFDEHLDITWNAVETVLNADPLNPQLLRRWSTCVTVGADNHGRAIIDLPSTSLRKRFAEAAYWHSGWMATEICIAPQDRIDVNGFTWEGNGDYAAAAQALADAAAIPHGYIQEVEHKISNGPGRTPTRINALAINYPRKSYPQQKVVDTAAGWPAETLPILGGVKTYPLLTADALLETDGYSGDTQIYLFLDDLPYRTGRQGAADIRQFLADFPFVNGQDRGPDEADLAGAVACALTPLVRYACGNAPMALFDKLDNRVGASKLSAAISLIVSGVQPYSVADGRDPDEGEKKLATAYKDGKTFLRKDNISGRLDDPKLAECLTQDYINFRRLGKNESIEVDGRVSSWMATGKRAEMTTELLERCHLIRLDAGHHSPSARTGPSTGPRAGLPWQFEEIEDAALDMRPQLLGGLVGMIRDWVKAGRPGPAPDTPTIGGYAAWRRIVGGILHLHGFTGFLTQRAAFVEQRDSGRSEVFAFIQEWWDWHKIQVKTVPELAALALLDGGPDGDSVPLVALHCKADSVVSRNKAMGKWLREECEGRLFPLDDGRTVRCLPFTPPSKRERAKGGNFRLAVLDGNNDEVVAAIEKSTDSTDSLDRPTPPRTETHISAGRQICRGVGELGRRSNESVESVDRPPRFAGDGHFPPVGDDGLIALEVLPANQVIECFGGCGRGLTLQDAWRTGYCRFCGQS